LVSCTLRGFVKSIVGCCNVWNPEEPIAGIIRLFAADANAKDGIFDVIGCMPIKTVVV
jgi:hypothetical protein